MNFEFSHLFKLPNILCYIRILLVPLFCVVFFRADAPSDFYIAAGIVLVSGITDLLDGQIARRFNMITDLGKIIDPLADKLMQLAMLVCLTIEIRYMFIMVIILVVKEIIMAAAALIFYKKLKKRLNGAKWYGKVCTSVLYAVMLILIAFPKIQPVYQYVLLLLSGLALMLSFVMYMKVYFRMMRDNKDGNVDVNIY